MPSSESTPSTAKKWWCPVAPGLRSINQHLGPDFRRVRIGIGHPGSKERVHGHVLGNYAKSEMDPLADMLAAMAAEAEWLAKGDDARFMNDIALRLQD